MRNGFTGGGAGTGGSPPGDWSSLIDLLRARASEARPGADYVFLTDGEREDHRVTYVDLDLRAREIAASLQGLARPGDRALLLYPPGLEFMESFFGCLYAGVVAVPAYPPRPNRALERIASIGASAPPTLILTTASLAAKAGAWADRVPGFPAARCLATDEPSPGAADLWRPPEAAPGRLAFLQYTSGSTAAPKGVMVSHATLLDNQRQIQRAFRQTTDSVVVSWLPPYHDMGLIGALLQPLFVGGSCGLMPPAACLQTPLRWLQAISRYRATTSGGPDFAYALCVARTTPEQRRELDLSSWQVAFNGAEPVRAATLARFTEAFGPCGFRPEAFFPCYGLAEATLMVTAAAGARTVSVSGAELQRHRVVPEEDGEGARRRVGCGRAGETARIAIADPETRLPVSSGGVGEIWLQGPSVAGGYWGQPEASRETFEARLAGEDGTFLRTGDLGFVLDGELFVTGRLKDLVIIRGRNHYPQDLELTAERGHPALRPDCGAAFSVTVDGEERLVIVQEIDRRREAEAAEAAEGIRDRILGEHDLNPFEVVVIRAGSIPKTSSGKIQRGACRDRYLRDGMEARARRRAGDLETARLAEEDVEDLASGEEPPAALMEALRGAVAGVLRRRA